MIIISNIRYNPSSTNSGYGDAGASHKKRALKGFVPKSVSPIHDIDFHNTTLRQRSRMLYMAAPIATSALRTNRTNVIGCGLKLKSRINRELLGLDADTAAQMERRIEAEFDLWASKKQSCDATGINDFYAIQQLAFISWLMSGDSFVLIKQSDTTLMNPYSLRLHLLEADRISTPSETTKLRNNIKSVDNKSIDFLFNATEGIADNGNKIHDGVEVDENGSVTGYYICSAYPEFNIIGTKPTWNRISAYGKSTGLPNILQIMDAERPDQYRGVPYLAHVIEPLLQMRRYTESELTAALIESYFTAFIQTTAQNGDMPFNETGESISSDPNDYEMGPGTINIMKPGEEVQFGDPKRPSSGFDAFMRSIAEQIGAALEIPADLLLKAFNASYSASRAALLEAWKSFKMRREWFVSDFCRPVYEIWFSEAVARGRIDAPGFFTDPLLRAAWLQSEWIGPSQGQLDPVKEINAELLAISQGLSTREQSTVRLNGGSWDANVEQIKKENERLIEAGIIPDIKLLNVQDDEEEKTDNGQEQKTA